MSDPDDPGGAASPDAVAIGDEQDIEVDTEALGRIARAVLAALGVDPAALLNVTLVDRATIADLKADAFGRHAATDVLSFPIDDPADPMPGPVVLGDVVICPAVALRHARALGRTLDDELAHLLIHGCLHVLGRDHQDPFAERAMAIEERALRAAAGVAA